MGHLTDSFILFILLLYVGGLLTWWRLFGNHELGQHQLRLNDLLLHQYALNKLGLHQYLLNQLT
jgi:hypothetical protein